MFGVAAEFKNVPLCDSHVLEHLPRCIGNAVYLLVNQFGGKIVDEVVETYVSVAAAQQRKEMVTKLSVVAAQIDSCRCTRGEYPSGNPCFRFLAPSSPLMGSSVLLS